MTHIGTLIHPPAVPAGLLARAAGGDVRKLRRAIAARVDRLIAVLDVLDGDPDLEPTGDEHDGTFAEDEETARASLFDEGPGCEISDPHYDPDEGREEEYLTGPAPFAWAG